MRAVELAKVAAAAEALRLRRLARRQALRVGFGAGAAVFGIAVFVLIHVLAYEGLAMMVWPWLAALILLVIDLVIAGLLASKALNSVPDRIEQEAMAVRRQSLAEAKRALTVMAVVGEVTGLAIGRGTRRAASGSRVGRAGMMIDIASRIMRRR